MALTDSSGSAATGNLGLNGKATLAIELGEDVSGLLGLPSGSVGNIIKVGGTGKSAVWSSSGHTLWLGYTVGASDTGAIAVDVAALRSALAGITDLAHNPATLGGSVWNSGSFAALTASYGVADLPTISSFAVADAGNGNGTALGKAGEAVTVNVRFGEAVQLTANMTYTVRVLIGDGTHGFDASLNSGATPGSTDSYAFTGTLPTALGLSSSALHLSALTLPSGASITSSVSNLLLGQTTYTLSSNAYAVDSSAPDAPSLQAGTDVTGTVSLPEAIAATGVVLVNAESGSRVLVTFTDDRPQAHSRVKTITGSGAPMPVTLDASDMGTGTNQLHDGSISVLAVATDAAGNDSAVSTSLSFALDTIAPAQPVVDLYAAAAEVDAQEAQDWDGMFTVTADAGTTVTVSYADSSTTPHRVCYGPYTSQGDPLPMYLLLRDLDAAENTPTTGEKLKDGTVTVTIVVTNPVGNTSSKSFTFTLAAALPAAIVSNALVDGVNSASGAVVLALDDAVDSDSSTSNGQSTTPYIHITGLEAGRSWQYSLDSGSHWTTVAAHNAHATDATLALPASSSAYAVGAVQVRRVADGPLVANPIRNTTTITVTPVLSVTQVLDNTDASADVTLPAQLARYLRISKEPEEQFLNWGYLRVWVIKNGVESELSHTGWAFRNSTGDTDLDYSNFGRIGVPESNNTTWLEADLGGYYTVSRVQMAYSPAYTTPNHQTVSLSINAQGDNGIGVPDLLADATVLNFNTGTLGDATALTLVAGLPTDDSTPTLKGRLPSVTLPAGTEYALYATRLDDANATPAKVNGTLLFSGLDWSLTPGSALADGRYAFTLVQQSQGNTSFANATARSNSMVLNIETCSGAPTLDLNGDSGGSNTSYSSLIGSASAINLTGKPWSPYPERSGPYLYLPSIQLGNDMTMEASVKLGSLAGGGQVFYIHNGYPWTDALVLKVEEDCRVTASAAQNSFTSSLSEHPALVPGSWYHLAYVLAGTSLTVYVDGTPWVQGTLTNGFEAAPSTLRDYVWIGRTPDTNNLPNMQIRNVRVYDDARTLNEIASDRANAPVDLNDPWLRSAYALQGSRESSIPGVVNLGVYGVPDVQESAVTLAPNAVLQGNTNIASIRVDVSGVLDGSNEKLVAAGVELSASGDPASGSLWSSNVLWNWRYAPAATGQGSFTFTAAISSGVAAGLAETFVQSLGYVDHASHANMGDRVLGISASNVLGPQQQRGYGNPARCLAAGL